MHRLQRDEHFSVFVAVITNYFNLFLLAVCKQ